MNIIQLEINNSKSLIPSNQLKYGLINISVDKSNLLTFSSVNNSQTLNLFNESYPLMNYTPLSIFIKQLKTRRKKSINFFDNKIFSALLHTIKREIEENYHRYI